MKQRVAEQLKTATITTYQLARAAGVKRVRIIISGGSSHNFCYRTLPCSAFKYLHGSITKCQQRDM